MLSQVSSLILVRRQHVYKTTCSFIAAAPKTAIQVNSRRRSCGTTTSVQMMLNPDKFFALREDDGGSLLDARMKEFVNNYAKQCQLVVMVAGGGGSFLSSISCTPGASQTFLQGINTYDRNSYHHYIEQPKPFPSFQYCSPEASKLGAKRARRQALHFASCRRPKENATTFQFMKDAVGLSCTSALSNDPSSSSRAYISVHLASHPYVYEVAMELQTSFSRKEQDESVAQSMLFTLQYALDRRIETSSAPTNADRPIQTYTTPEGHKVILKTVLEDDGIIPQEDLSLSFQESDFLLQQAIQQLLEEKRQIVMLLYSRDTKKLDVLSDCVFPPHSILFPGSFNPPHEGHVELVQAALEASGTKIPWFEMSVSNPDKASLSSSEILRRLSFFHTIDMPNENWGVVLTNAPLFFGKVDLLRPYMVPDSSTPRSSQDSKSPVCFVVGADTLERILDPKYYDGSTENMLRLLESHQPFSFVVGGRLQQKRVGDPSFVSGADLIKTLPDSLQSSFTVLSDFRVDISSSEIRRQQRDSKN